MNLLLFDLKGLGKILIFSLLVLSFNKLFSQNQNNNYSLDIISFFSPKIKLAPLSEVDLKGSSVTPLLNFGQQFFLKKRIPMSKHLSLSFGGGFGYNISRMEYISTSEFRDRGSRYDFDYWRISDEGVLSFSVIGEIGYQTSISENGSIGIDVGIRPTYMLNRIIGFNSGFSRATFQAAFSAQFNYNSENVIRPFVDINPYYLHQFKNPRFGFKGGVSISYAPFNPIKGKFFLFGDDDTFEADIKGNVSFVGLSMGIVYFPSTIQ